MVQLDQATWFLGPGRDPKGWGYIFRACGGCGTLALEEEVWPPVLHFNLDDLGHGQAESSEPGASFSVACPNCGRVFLEQARSATSEEIRDAGFAQGEYV